MFNVECEDFIRVRTDLILESSEIAEPEEEYMSGIRIEEKNIKEKDIKITDVQIISDTAAKRLGKQKGRYITIEAASLIDSNEESYHINVSEELKKAIISMLSMHNNIRHILVAGLGNHDAMPDALGPVTVSNLRITRNIDEDAEYIISAIVPNVMAKTGMESAEVLQGIVAMTHPDLVIVIDALAARRMERLGRTIQITDTGIAPGSGVMNRRKKVNKEVLGVPVIAIGVPTVIDAGTIVYDVISKISSDEDAKELKKYIDDYSENMYVTPKDIDDYIKRVSYTLSEAINGMSGIKK
ncbi:MAG: GPR endopeptidase [Lachnospiraceae bacterium]|nr:GPR endopeptidase [Lachnospiraceae bacterium]MEE0959718.1 GPR endopeptidase [Lachnospiraceae bacterium]